MNLREVPDDVCSALAQAAEQSHQSLNAFVVDRLAELAGALAERTGAPLISCDVRLTTASGARCTFELVG